jgi:hypothetical protein
MPLMNTIFSFFNPIGKDRVNLFQDGIVAAAGAPPYILVGLKIF